MRTHRALVVGSFVLGMLALPVSARAEHTTRPDTPNVYALGYSPQPGSFLIPDGQRTVNTDLAFWGGLVFQGNYDGFRIVDITEPGDPRLVSWTHCNGGRGDIVVWQNVLVRSWNSKKLDARDCDGTVVPAGWEGVHVFDISDPANPKIVAAVGLPCGSHTVTVGGVTNQRLIVYSNNSSSSGCVDGGHANDDSVGDFVDIIAVPLEDPGSASLIHREPLAGPTTTARTGCTTWESFWVVPTGLRALVPTR